MKKFITFSMICCFALSSILVLHERVCASDDDNTAIGITVGIVGLLALIAVLAVVGTNDANDQHKAWLDNKITTINDTFKSRLGSWTYDDALSLWGAPTSVTEGGNIIVATYDSTTKSNVGNTVYHEGYFFDPDTSDTKTNEVKNGEVFTLIFDKSSKVLKGWNWKIFENSVAVRQASNGQAVINAQNTKKGAVQPVPYDAGNAAKSAPAPSPASTLKQKLTELKKLFDSGDITKEEYNKTRAKLIDSFQ